METQADPSPTHSVGDDNPGSTPLPDIADFEVLGELGRGGMGVVYLARQLSLPRQVAIKTLSTEHTGQAGLTRFLREAEVIADLSHPNVVQIYQLGQCQDRPYFAMEFCAGGNLAARLAGQPQPPLEAATTLAILARAVHFAHQRGVIHRDLKPANVLLTVDGTPKVSDFGLARRQEHSDLTRSGAIVGTPSYLSPEQASQSSLVGPASDTWALGVILYEMLTGRVPFRAANAIETLLLICTQEPVSPRLIVPGLSRDLETICLKCLEKDAHRRYASAGELADDLERFCQGQPTLARPAGPVRRLAKWARRKPAWAILSLVSALALATVVGLSVAFSVLFQGERDEAVRQKNDADDLRRVAEQRLDDNRKLTVKIQEQLDDNRKLTVKAQESEAVARRELTRARHHLMTAQMLRATPLLTTEPGQALPLLEDCTACPLDLRDFAWHFLYRQARRDRYLLVIPRSAGGRVSLTYSGDSRLLAAQGTMTTTLPIWDARTGAQVQSLSGDGSYFKTLAFSNDGKLLAAALALGNAGEIRLWDTHAWQVRKVPMPDVIPIDLAIHPEGRSLAVVDGKGNVHTIDVAAARVTGVRPPPEEARGKLLRIHPDGTTLLAFDPTGKTAQLWPAGKNEPSLKFPNAASARFSSDGKLLLVGERAKDTLTGKLRLYDGATGALRQTIPLGPAAPETVALDTRAGLLAEPRFETEIRVRDLTSGALRLQLALPFTPRHEIQLAVAPDGRSLASISMQHLRLWDLRPDLPRHTFTPGEQQRADSVAFRPDGSIWVIGRENQSVKAWDLVTGKEVLSLDAGERLYRAEMAPDGKSLFLTTAQTVPDPARPGSSLQVGVLHVWDLATRQRRHVFRHEGVLTPPVLVTADGKTAITHCTEQGKTPSHAIVRAWNLETGKAGWEWRRETTSSGGMHQIALDPVGNRLAVATSSYDSQRNQFSSRTTFLDLAGGREQGSLEHGNPLTAQRFSPDGRWLLTSPHNGVLQWHDDKGPGPQVPGLATGAIVSPDSRLVATLVGPAAVVRLYDVLTGQERATIPENALPVAFSPDGETLICRDQRIERFSAWEVVTPERAIWRLDYTALALAVSPDGQTLAFAAQSKDGPQNGLRLVDRVTGKDRGRANTGQVSVVRLAFSRDGRLLLTAGLEKMGGERITSTLTIREADTGRTVAEQRLANVLVTSIAWADDEARVYWAGQEAKTNRWQVVRLDLKTGESRSLFAGRPGNLHVHLTPDGSRYLIVYPQGKRVEAYERDGKALATWTDFPQPLIQATLSPDGRVLATMEESLRDQPSRLRLWDVDTGKLLREAQGLVSDTGWRMVFSPDGRLLASGNTTGAIRIWTVADGKELATWQAHAAGVTALAFSSDGKELLSSGDTTVRLWPVPPR